MSVLQSCLDLVTLLEFTGTVLDTLCNRAYSPVPTTSSEKAQDCVPATVLIQNAVKSMEDLL